MPSRIFDRLLPNQALRWGRLTRETDQWLADAVRARTARRVVAGMSERVATSGRTNSHDPAADTCIVCWEINPPDGGLWDDDGFVCHRCDLGAFVDVGELEAAR